jgi:hypothetical protein
MRHSAVEIKETSNYTHLLLQFGSAVEILTRQVRREIVIDL